MKSASSTAMVLGVFVLIFIGAFIPSLYKAYQEAEKLRKEREVTQAILEVAAEDPLKFAEAVDAWGHGIRFTHSEGVVDLSVARSAGPDGIFDNQDDMVEENRDWNLKQTGKVTGHAATEVTLGAVDGVKESLKENGVTAKGAGESVGEKGGKFFSGLMEGYKKSKENP